MARRIVREVVLIARGLGIEIDPYEPGLYADPEQAKRSGDAIGLKPNERVADSLMDRARDVGPFSASMRMDVKQGRGVEMQVRYMLRVLES